MTLHSRVLFTADLHINLTKKNVPTDWQVSRYIALFEEIANIVLEKEVNLIVVGGDIFDKYPTIEELCLYFKMLEYFSVDTIIFDGNHEATKRGESFLHSLVGVTEKLNSKVRILTEPTSYREFDFIPYTHIKSFNPKSFSNDILFTHVRGEIKPHVKPEIDLNKLNRWDFVFAGDLHSYSNSQRNIIYPGSPLTVTFHRKHVDTGVIVYDTKTKTSTWLKLELPQLIRKRVSEEDDMLETDFDHTIYELEGSAKELSRAKNSKLLDKKIVNTKSTSELGFSPNFSVDDELLMYLRDVLELGKSDIERVVGRHNDNISSFKME